MATAHRAAIALLTVACASVDAEGTGPTWHEVGPLLAERCGSCHQPGAIGPFDLLDRETAATWGEAIVAAVTTDRMPPFFARTTDECEPPFAYQHDPTLTDEEVALLVDWVAADAPEGPPLDEPLAAPPVEQLEADGTYRLPAPFTVDGTRDIYACFRIPLDNTEDIWVDGVEVRPGNDQVVHHVLVWHDADDGSRDRANSDGYYPCSGDPGVWPAELLGAWAPGAPPARPPEGTGMLVHPGASLVVNVHYHPTAGPQVDQTEIALSWTREQPAQHATWYLVDLPFGARSLDPPFAIPAGASDHVEESALVIPPLVPFDLGIFAVAPHMHYLGREMKVDLVEGSGARTCLVHTPSYRFDYQTSYVFDAPPDDLPVAQAGDSLVVRCTYDNSPSNPALPLHLEARGVTEPGEVHWGEETGDEMCMAIVGLVIPPVDWLALSRGLR